jgi:hypothetical protein
MEIIKEITTPAGVYARLEDWTEDYPGLKYRYMVAAYPQSQWTMPGAFAPKAGETFRADFIFKDMPSAVKMLNEIEIGTGLELFTNLMYRKEYACCITGRVEG